MAVKEYATLEQTTRARDLRLNNTDAEQRLWNALRNCQLGGYKFRRQYPVGTYILDFVCDAEKLCVELDGGQHNVPQQQAYDEARTAFLEKNGWRVLRFWNNEVMENIEGVQEVILQALIQNQLR